MTTPSPSQMPGTVPSAPTEGGTPPVAPVAPSEPVPPAPQDPPAAEQPNPTPPWGDDKDFDPAKAWDLIQNLRGDKATLQTKLSEAAPVLQAAEDARRAEQGELVTARQDLTAAAQRAEAWRSAAVQSKAEALAAAFVDPLDAVTFIGDLSEYVDGDTIDTEKLTGRLTQLASEKPYLLKAAQPQGFLPNRGQGQSGTGQIPIDAQIKAAQDRGDLMTAIALKQHKHYQNQK